MDFNTVKRKLADLRKSLEASGSLPASRKKGKGKGKKTTTSEPPARSAPGTSGVCATGPPTTSAGVLNNPQMNPLTSPQAGPHGIPQHLHLSMLGLQHPGAAQQAQQQPLNLQTTNASPQTSNDLPLNLHSAGSNGFQYYLSLGHMSNLIPLPAPGTSQVPTTQTPVFPGQPNMQQFIPGQSQGQSGVGVVYSSAPHTHNMY